MARPVILILDYCIVIVCDRIVSYCYCIVLLLYGGLSCLLSLTRLLYCILLFLMSWRFLSLTWLGCRGVWYGVSYHCLDYCIPCPYPCLGRCVGDGRNLVSTLLDFAWFLPLSGLISLDLMGRLRRKPRSDSAWLCLIFAWFLLFFRCRVAWFRLIRGLGESLVRTGLDFAWFLLDFAWSEA